MRGSLTQRHPGSWSLVLDLGYQTDPETGLRKRKQKWVTFRGTKKQAETKLTDLVRDANKGEFVEPTKLTLGEWLTLWLAETVKPARRLNTYIAYNSIVTGHLVPALGTISLQALRPGHLKQYYAERREQLSGATLQLHHAILSNALKSAVRQGLVTRNVASLVDGVPRAQNGREDAKQHCWTIDETRTFLAAAKQAGPQLSALFALALDTGMRKGELCGLKWNDVDLDAGRVTVDRQLLVAGPEPVFGPTKTGAPRGIDLTDETVRLLREHKRQQAELKMRNRQHYRDHGLVFAKEWGELHGQQDALGLPLQGCHLGQREFARVIKAADVRRIKFHGLRHTCATLLLAAGEPVHVVAARLGHKDATITMKVYAHVLPSMQQQAARTIGTLLYGS